MPKFARRVFDRVRMADMMTARFANRAGFYGFGTGSNDAAEIKY